MATKKKPLPDRGSVDKAMKAAAAVVTREPPEEPDDKGKITAVRLNSREHEFLKTIFETKGKGLALSTGIKMAALWIAEKIDDGALSISKAGIADRR
jgi:hypothetical protein